MKTEEELLEYLDSILKDLEEERKNIDPKIHLLVLFELIKKEYPIPSNWLLKLRICFYLLFVV